MVKITDPNKTEPSTRSNNNHAEDLTPEDFKKMLKPEKQSTTPINIRLESSIANQIEQYSKEHNTTKTEVIKNILSRYYGNRKINKGTFQLKEPVNLIIPQSKKLLTEYIEKEINIIFSNNPLDQHRNLYDTGKIYIETITEVNNLLDQYYDVMDCYCFSMTEDLQEETQKIFNEELIIIESTPYLYHRGLIYVTLNQEEDTTAILIDVLCKGNELIRAVIIDINRAVELARVTNNFDLIKFLHENEDYIRISEMVYYEKSNKQLREENRELKRSFKELEERYFELEHTLDAELEYSKELFEEKEETSLIKYVEHLEKLNKDLNKRIEELEIIEDTHNKTMAKLEEMAKLFTEKE